MLDGPIDLPTNCRAATVTHVRFLTRIICHTKRISDSQEKRDTSREKRETSREKQGPSHEKRDERWSLTFERYCTIKIGNAEVHFLYYCLVQCHDNGDNYMHIVLYNSVLG